MKKFNIKFIIFSMLLATALAHGAAPESQLEPRSPKRGAKKKSSSVSPSPKRCKSDPKSPTKKNALSDITTSNQITTDTVQETEKDTDLLDYLEENEDKSLDCLSFEDWERPADVIEYQLQELTGQPNEPKQTTYTYKEKRQFINQHIQVINANAVKDFTPEEKQKQDTRWLQLDITVKKTDELKENFCEKVKKFKRLYNEQESASKDIENNNKELLIILNKIRFILDLPPATSLEQTPLTWDQYWNQYNT